MIFLDTDVLLDIAWKREPFWQGSANVMANLKNIQTEMCLTSIVLSNLHYLISKHKTEKIATKFNLLLLNILKLLSHEEDDFRRAYLSTFTDKEDGVNYYTCLRHDVKLIITRNKRDFKTSALPVLTPEEFLTRL